MNNNCAVCSQENPARAINANYWVADSSETPFGGHYERREFCTMECVKAAPKYVAPKKARVPKAKPCVMPGGGWSQAASMSRKVR